MTNKLVVIIRIEKMQPDVEMEAGVRSLLEVNNLAYRMTPGMSVATSRVTREWNSIRATYNEGDILSFPISSGAAYVDPDNSYIVFDVDIIPNANPIPPATPNSGQNYMFFWGSDTKGRQNALNLFQSMRLTHSSGYEIDRVTRGFAPWRYIQNSYTKDKQWHDTYGSLMRGYQTSQVGSLFYGRDGSGGAYPRAVPSIAPGNFAPTAIDDFDMYPVSNNVKIQSAGGPPITIARNWCLMDQKPFASDGLSVQTITFRAIIPLSAISGVWDTDQLSPSFLMAGARLDLTLQNHQQVWQVRSRADPSSAPNVITANNYNYTLRNAKIVLETITFTDAVLRSISMTSANVGLEIPFIAMHSVTAPINTDDMSVQINRGLSRANLIVARVYPNTADDNSDRCCTIDSVSSYFINPAAQGWQVKLGAEFMPAIPIRDGPALYHATQVAFGNWKADRRNTVTMEDYLGSGPYNPNHITPAFRFCPYAPAGCYAMTLEKSSTLAQSGSPISAARDLNVVFGGPDFNNYTDVLWNGLSVDVFVPYVTLATVFLDSVLTRS